MSGEPTPLIEEHWFDDDGVVPNNSRLPLVVYRGVSRAASARLRPVRRCSPAMAGAAVGAAAFIPTTTTTAPRMKRSASSPARLRCVLAATAAPSSICMPAMWW